MIALLSDPVFIFQTIIIVLVLVVAGVFVVVTRRRAAAIRQKRERAERIQRMTEEILDQTHQAIDKNRQTAEINRQMLILENVQQETWSKEHAKHIYKRVVTVGMNPDMVKTAFGEPDHVEDGGYKGHDDSEYRFVYDQPHHHGKIYVYFANNEVINIEDLTKW